MQGQRDTGCLVARRGRRREEAPTHAGSCMRTPSLHFSLSQETETSGVGGAWYPKRSLSSALAHPQSTQALCECPFHVLNSLEMVLGLLKAGLLWCQQWYKVPRTFPCSQVEIFNSKGGNKVLAVSKSSLLAPSSCSFPFLSLCDIQSSVIARVPGCHLYSE